VLRQMLLPDIRYISGDTFVFQQDSAPAHCTQATVEFLARDTSEFIPPKLWPPNSRDLNRVDYSVWEMLQERVYRTHVADLDELKQRLRTEWAKMDHSITIAAIRQSCRNLSVCVRADGGHFKHCF